MMKKYIMTVVRIGATTLFILAFINSSQVFAKVVFGSHVQVNDIGSSPHPFGYHSMAIDTSGNIYVVWSDFRNGNQDIYFAKSTDGGASFGTDVRVDDTGFSDSDQLETSIAIGINGDIYVAWTDERNGNRDIYFAKSTDGGNSFQPNIRVDDTGSSISDQQVVSMATDTNGNIYMAWQDERNGDADIYFSKSTDGGDSFGPNIRVDDTGSSTSDQYFPSIAMDINGNIYVAWEDFRNGDSATHLNSDIYFTKSTDGGTSFGINVRVDDTGSLITNQACPSIDIDRFGNIYVAWDDKRNGNYDIYFAKSTDGGTSFGTNIRVDDAASSNISQVIPSIATDINGNVYVAWYDDRNGSPSPNYWTPCIYFAKSTDGGASFEMNIRVDDLELLTFYQGYPSIAVDESGNIYIAWGAYRLPTFSDSAIYLSKGTEGTPGPVTNFSAQPGIEHILLSWTNPVDADWAGTMIVRKENDYPQNSSDGNIIYNGKNSSYMDINYTLLGLTYYYTAFAYDSKRNYSEAVPSAQGMAAALESPFVREYGAKVNGIYLPVAYVGQIGDTCPVLTDVDGDDDMDLLVGTKEGYIHFYRNDGNVSAPQWILANTNYDSDKGLYGGTTIALCDIDNDGDEDMFTGGQDGTIGFYRKEGDFWVRLWDFGPIDVGNYSELALCDIDNDGDYDLFVGEQYGHICFYRNDGSATEPSFVLISSNYGSIDVGDRSAPVFCDIDNDDDYDMFIGNSAGKLSFYRNDGTPGSASWTFVTSDYDSIDVANNSIPTFCDIDNDGDYDMFIGNGNGDILFYENTGSSASPSWDFVINYTHIDVVSNSVPVFCDIDGDRDCDMFISNWNGAITFYRNDGTKASPSWTFVTDKYNSIERQTYIMPSFCDIDNDGDYDMFIGDIGGQIDFYRNNGTATEAVWAQKIFNYANIDVCSCSAPAFCDIDNDGDYDLFIGNIYGNLYFYRNDGTSPEPQWTFVSDNYGDLNIGNLARPSFGDIDGDGDYDMCVGSERAYYYDYRGLTDLFENIGTPESPSWEYMMTINYPVAKGAYIAPTLCDIDRDNDADLFVGDRSGCLRFWRNMIITNVPPEVTISSIMPNPAYKGDNVTFNGTAEDEGDEIVVYKWTSSIDGLLSESVSFSRNTLSVGTHTITFKAQDSYGTWSEPATVTLEVKPATYELSLKDGETVSGNVYVTMSYKGVKLPYFQFMVDEKLVNSNPWRTQYFLNGAHTVYGQYPDQVNRVWRKTEPITVIVNNALSYAPEIISPKDGATLSGDVSISFRAEGATPYFAFIVVNNKIIGGKILLGQQSPYSFIWKTAKFQNGQYDINVIVYYLYAGISTSRSVHVTINNSSIPTPIINLICPNPASGIVNVHISSTDDNDFFAPMLYVDGKFIGFKWWMPCDISWDTRKFANGLHNLHFQTYYYPLKKWLVIEKTIEVRN